MQKKAIIILAFLIFIPLVSAETAPLKMIFSYFGHSTIATSQGGDTTYINNTYNNITQYNISGNTTDDILNVIYLYVYNETFRMLSEGIPWSDITGEPDFQTGDEETNSTDEILGNVIYPYVYNNTFITWSSGIPWFNITGAPAIITNETGYPYASITGAPAFLTSSWNATYSATSADVAYNRTQWATDNDTQRGNLSSEMSTAINATGVPYASITGHPAAGGSGGVNISTTTCSGTNKVSAINNATGAVTCTADSGAGTAFSTYNYTTQTVTTNAVAMTKVIILPLTGGKTSMIECELFTYSVNATNTAQFNVTFLGTTSRGVNSVRYYTSATAIAFANSTAVSFLVSPTSGAGAAVTTWELFGYSTQSTSANMTIYIQAEIAGSRVGVNPYSWCRSVEI